MTIIATALRSVPDTLSPGPHTPLMSPARLPRIALPACLLVLLTLPASLPVRAQSTPSQTPSQTQSQTQSQTPAPAADDPNAPAKPAQPATAPDATAPAPQTAPPSAATGGNQVDSSTYVVGPDDVLQITVWHEPTLSGVLPVRPDGMISLALLGDVKAAGYTPVQLSADLAQRLRKYIQDPSVTVAVTAVNSKRVFLVGEVARVGPMPLTPGMTPLQAISTAGGPSPFANAKHIYILRGTGAKQQKIPFNYKQALKGDDKSGLTLQPGDTIVVP